MIKAIIFDLGGVVTIEYKELFYDSLANALGVSDRQMKDILAKWHSELTRGEKTIKEMYTSVIRQLGKDITADDMLEKHMEIMKKTILGWNNKVVEYVKELREKYLVACLTNSEIEPTEYNRNRGLFDLFEKAFISTEMGMEKPDENIYLAALKDINCKPEETVFIDNIPEFVEAAEKVGMKGIIFKDSNQLKKDLAKLD